MSNLGLHIDECNHAEKILRKLDSMRKEQRNCDLVICAEGKKIHVNKVVMCAASDYFDAMFSHDTKEKQEGVVEMKDVQFSSVEKCIDYIYSGKLDVSEEECEGLLYCASLMQLNEICDKISPFLEDCISVKSFFKIRIIAIKFSLKKLSTACDEFALNQIFLLAKEKEFNNLDLDFISFLLSANESSDEELEDFKLKFSLEWIKSHPTDREKHLMKFIKLIKTSKLTARYIRFLIENEPLCMKSAEFMKELCLGLTASSTVEAPGASSSSILDCPNSLLMFNESQKNLLLYEPSSDSLTEMKDSCYEMKNKAAFTTCVYEEYLYVFNEFKQAFCLDINSGISTWKQLPAMLYDHGAGIQCAVLESYIYVGGKHAMERYNIHGDKKWENIDVSGITCHCSALVSYERSLFVIGGNIRHRSLSVRDVAKLRLLSASTTWVPKGEMNFERQNASATVFGEKIYVAGGWKHVKLKSFEMYDGLSDSWTILPEMNSVRFRFRLCVVDDRIFAIGNHKEECSIEVYDMNDKTWQYANSPKLNIWSQATVPARIPTSMMSEAPKETC